jgi:NADH:ubiquinone oxidoreductase subunit 6 (subunit J)
VNIVLPGNIVEVALFALFAIGAIGGALRVITASDPFVSALSLLINFVSLGGLYLLLNQSFVALSQILVYAGAVVVLFLFVIAYLGDRRELTVETTRATGLRALSIGLAVVCGILLVSAIFVAALPPAVEQLPTTKAGFAFGSPQAFGEVFLTRFAIPFEFTSVVLLVAAVGGVVLGLTGRARHDRLRKLMQTRSADQQRRAIEAEERELVERRRAEREQDRSGSKGQGS